MTSSGANTRASWACSARASTSSRSISTAARPSLLDRLADRRQGRADEAGDVQVAVTDHLDVLRDLHTALAQRPAKPRREEVVGAEHPVGQLVEAVGCFAAVRHRHLLGDDLAEAGLAPGAHRLPGALVAVGALTDRALAVHDEDVARPAVQEVLHGDATAA